MRSIAPEVTRIGNVDTVLGETPVWSAREQALYWINVEPTPQIQRWASASGEVKSWVMPKRIGGIALKPDGGALVVLADGVYDFDFATGEVNLRAKSPLPHPIALHECVCDPTGRFWTGSINEGVGAGNPFPGGAGLFRLEGSELIQAFGDVSCANGLAFSPDGRTLYFSDSTTQRCDRYALDPVTGELGPRETLFQLGEGEGFVDGATVDAAGGYWAALVYVGKLRRYLPDGTPDVEIALPFANPTKLAFGGPELRTIFVTTIKHGLGGEQPTALDGGLFAIETDFVGRLDPEFEG